MAPADLGLRIKRARERKRMSQRELAAAIEVGVRSIGRWERGEAVPRSAIGALEAVLGTSLTQTADIDPKERELEESLIRLDIPADQRDELMETYRRRRGNPGQAAG